MVDVFTRDVSSVYLVPKNLIPTTFELADPNFIAKFAWTRLLLQKLPRFIPTLANWLHLMKKDVLGNDLTCTVPPKVVLTQKSITTQNLYGIWFGYSCQLKKTYLENFLSVDLRGNSKIWPKNCPILIKI